MSAGSRSRWLCVAGLAALIAAAVPAHAATVFGLLDTGEIYASADAGGTWSPLSTLPVRDAAALSARFNSTDLFLASRSGSIFRSTNAAATWTAVGTIAATDLVDLAIRPDGALLVLTAAGSIHRSTDLGATFTPLAAITGPDFVSLTYTTPAAKLYALARTGEVFESSDGGTNWTPKGVLAVPDARRIRSVGSSLYVMTETGDVFRSTDAGADWIPVGTMSQSGMRGLVRSGTGLVAASREGHVAVSTDGVAWAWTGSMNQLSLTALASDEPATTGITPEPPGVVFLGAPYPHPSNGAASFALRLERGAEVALSLYDVAGRLVSRRAAQRYAAGSHVVSWDPAPPASGLYVLAVATDSGPVVTRRWLVFR